MVEQVWFDQRGGGRAAPSTGRRSGAFREVIERKCAAIRNGFEARTGSFAVPIWTLTLSLTPARCWLSWTDRSLARHLRKTFQSLRLPLMTSETVLTELFHLVGDSRYEMQTAWKFLRSGAIRVFTIEESKSPEVQALMLRYGERRMDFADATLVYLARRERLSTVFTVDHADFHAYRIDGRKRFRVLPSIR